MLRNIWKFLQRKGGHQTPRDGGTGTVEREAQCCVQWAMRGVAHDPECLLNEATPLSIRLLQRTEST